MNRDAIYIMHKKDNIKKSLKQQKRYQSELQIYVRLKKVMLVSMANTSGIKNK